MSDDSDSNTRSTVRKRKRPTFRYASKRRIKVREVKTDKQKTEMDNGCSEEEEELFDSESVGGYSSRDLSPVEQVRMYVADCATEMVEDFEKIYQKMSGVAETAAARSSAMMSTGADMVQRTAKGGAVMVQRTAKGGADMVHFGGELMHSGAEMVQSAGADMVHLGEELMHSGAEMAKTAVKMPAKVLEKVKHWKAHSFTNLPAWMKDNEHLHFGHRPELQSFKECFKSIFRIHTETGNIWTHLVGFVFFIAITIVFYVKPLCDNCHFDIKLSEKLIFLFFFIGAILCLGMSSLFHTVCCHSEHVSNLFSKLDYTGIALLTIGSFVPWIYYSFYCQATAQIVYLTSISVLGVGCIGVTLMDRFNQPDYRVYRAVLFVCLGCFGFVPGIHTVVQVGWSGAISEASLDRVLLMAFLYIFGAFLYGARIPERFLPGKCDIWFQSHQIFHLLVVAAAIVHYNGISEMAVYRLTKAGECAATDSRSLE